MEDLHHLDLVMDATRSHWDWVIKIANLYRSAIIYSNGQYKLITDRGDLPIRQVFHAGNTIPGRTEVRIGGNPVKPNQANVTYSDRDMGYIQNTLFVQDSAALLNEPLKPINLDLSGITRRNEAVRQASVFLQRNQVVRREVTISTGLEGLAVEPGDRAKMGVIMTNYEAGYGGRALDGSLSHIVLDREIAVSSGYSYELLVWHTAADTVETRTLGTSPCSSTITVSPTAGFTYQVVAGDRWAIGISSEDLFDVRVRDIKREPDGIHTIAAEQYIPINYTFNCDSATPPATPLSPPLQPQSTTITISDCTLCVQMTPNASSSTTIDQIQIDVRQNVAVTSWETLGFIQGTSGCIDITGTFANLIVMASPVNANGNISSATAVYTMSAPGCQDLEETTNVSTIGFPGSETPIYAVTFPGSTLDLNGFTTGEINVTITEVCSPANETTEMSLALTYGGQRLVSSLVVLLNDANSQSTMGTKPAVIKFQIQNLGVASAQQGILQYNGPTNSGFVNIGITGVGSVDSTLTQTLSVLAAFRHYDTTGAVHSHDCFFISTDRASQTLPDEETGLLPFPLTPFTSNDLILSAAAVNSGVSIFAITHNRTNANAIVAIYTNWNTTTWLTSLTANAGVVNFGTAAPASAEISWRVI